MGRTLLIAFNIILQILFCFSHTNRRPQDLWVQMSCMDTFVGLPAGTYSLWHIKQSSGCNSTISHSQVFFVHIYYRHIRRSSGTFVGLLGTRERSFFRPYKRRVNSLYGRRNIYHAVQHPSCSRFQWKRGLPPRLCQGENLKKISCLNIIYLSDVILPAVSFLTRQNLTKHSTACTSMYAAPPVILFRALHGPPPDHTQGDIQKGSIKHLQYTL